MHNERPLPHDLTIEESVIGSILKEPVLVNEALRQNISEQSFYNPVCVCLFKALKYLYVEQGQLPDLPTLANRLRFSGELEKIGGPGKLTELLSEIATTVNFQAWCRLIRQLHSARVLISLQTKSMTDVYSAPHDIDVIINRIKKDVFKVEDIAGTKLHLDTVTKLAESLDEITRNLERGTTPGVKYCLPGMDELLTHSKKECHVLAADSNIGKTGLMLNVMNARIDSEIGDALFCHETPYPKLFTRLICIRAGISSNSIYRMTRDELERYKKAVVELKEKSHLFWLFGKGDFEHSPLGIDLEIKRIQEESGGLLQACTVDYLQNMRVTGPLAKASRAEQIEANMFAINNVFGENDIAGTVLCQLNRDKERDKKKKAPQLSDCKGSSAIEQEADYVTFIHRDRKLEGNVTVDWYSEKMRGPNRIMATLDFNTHTGIYKGVSNDGHRYGQADIPATKPIDQKPQEQELEQANLPYKD